jgi:hypothetical protein
VAIFARRFPVATVGGAAAGAASRAARARRQRRPGGPGAPRAPGTTDEYDVEGTAVDVDPPSQPRLSP